MHSQGTEKDHDAELATPDEQTSTNSRDLDVTEDHEKQDRSLSNEPVTQQPPPPPDGGYGWVCTACCAVINAHTWGKSLQDMAKSCQKPCI